MGGGQTSTTNSTQVSTRTPWDPAIPGLTQSLADAQNLYQSGVGSQVYGGQRVADLSQNQQAGIQGTMDQAAADNAGGVGVSGLQNIIQGGGMNPYTQQGIAALMGVQGVTAPTATATTIGLPTAQASYINAPTVSAQSISAPTIAGASISRPQSVQAQSILGQSGLDANGLSQGTLGALSTLAGVQGASTGDLSNLAQYIRSDGNPVNATANAFMNGARDLTTQPQLQSLYSQTQAPSYAEQNLAGIASGQYLDPTTNPFVQALVNTSNQNAANATKEAYAASGRYGSGNFAGAMTKAINDTDTQLYANQYNTEAQRQLSANSQMDAARQARLGLGENITNDISNVQNTNNQNRLAGAGLGQAQQAQAANVLGQVLAGDQFNSNLGLQQAQSGLATYQQGTANRLGALTSDAANNLNAQQFNVNADQAAQQYNATNALNTQQYNAGNNLAAQQYNANALMNTGQFNAGNNLAAQQYNANADMQTGQFNASNNLAGQQFNANALNNMAQYNGTNNLNAQQFNSNLGVQQAMGEIGAGQQATNAVMQAASALPAVDGLRYAPASNLLQVGGLQQSQAQNELAAAQQYFNETQQTPWQALSEYASFPLAIGSQGGTTVSQGTQRTETSGPSALQSILGLGTSLLGLGTGGGATLGGGLAMGLLGSDERMKENIRRVGELKDGQPVYSYNYRGDDRTQIGLLAHEVAEKNPDAVGPIGIGDLAGVDYGKATDEAARLSAKGKKGGGSSGGSAPAAAPPAERPGVTIMVEGRSPHDPQASALSQGLGAFAAELMSGGLRPGVAGGIGPMMQAALLAAKDEAAEPAPTRTSATRPQTRGKRRAAA